MSSAALAANRTWIGPTGNVFPYPNGGGADFFWFHENSRWSPGSQPTTADIAIFNGSATYGVHFLTGQPGNTGGLRVENGQVIFRMQDHYIIHGSGTALDVSKLGSPSNGATLWMFGNKFVDVLNGDSVIANQAGSSGRIILAPNTPDGYGTGTFQTHRTLYVGLHGNGTLLSEGGGDVISNDGIIAYGTGSTGVATIRNAGSSWYVVGDLTVGQQGNGTLNINSGATVDSGSGKIGAASGGTGQAIVNGSGSLWSNVQGMNVGVGGYGDLFVENNGRVTSASGLVGSFGIGNVHVNSGGNWTVSGSLSFGIGNTHEGLLDLASGGVVNSVGATLGYLLQGSGRAYVEGTNTQWNVTGNNFYIGDGGTGYLQLYNAARLSTTHSYIADDTSSSGQAYVYGTNTLWTTNNGYLAVGNNGYGKLFVYDSAQVTTGTHNLDIGIGYIGELTISNNGKVTNAQARLGINAVSDGVATITGTGSKWTNTANLIIGHGGEGTMRVLSNGEVTSVSSSVGNNSGSFGTAELSTGGKWNLSSGLVVGSSGTGTVTVESGASISSQIGNVGVNAGSTGTVTVTGASSSWTTNNSYLGVGLTGTGILKIEDSGQVTSGDFELGRNSNGKGTLDLKTNAKFTSKSATTSVNPGSESTITVNGTGTKWTITEDLAVGYAATSNLTIGTGGEVQSANIYAGYLPNAAADITVEGTWRTTGSFFAGVGGEARMYVVAGGLLSTGPAYLATQALSDAYVVVHGTGAEWTTNNNVLNIGGSGTAYVEMFNNGKLNTGTGDLNVAVNGIASFNINGGQVSSFTGMLGGNAGSDGTAIVKNAIGVGQADGLWTITQHLVVGNLGKGTLNISNSGKVTSQTGYLAAFNGSEGNVSVTGSGSSWNATNLYLGGNATTASTGKATLTIADQGFVKATGTTKLWSADDTINVNGGTFETGILDALVGAINITNGTLLLTSGTSTVTNLSINAPGKLDLTNNDLIVNNGSLAALTALLAAGLDINGSYGNGPGINGITSSTFAANPNFNTVLGIASNADLGYATFSGQTIDANDVLIKYTYFGDADLNGVVDGATDFDLYITGLTNGGSLGGWLYGDFDYNGSVDSATDFDLYITGLSSQGGPLLTVGGGVNLVQAVPEPSTFALIVSALGMSALHLIRRKRGIA